MRKSSHRKKACPMNPERGKEATIALRAKRTDTRSWSRGDNEDLSLRDRESIAEMEPSGGGGLAVAHENGTTWGEQRIELRKRKIRRILRVRERERGRKGQRWPLPQHKEKEKYSVGVNRKEKEHRDETFGEGAIQSLSWEGDQNLS